MTELLNNVKGSVDFPFNMADGIAAFQKAYAANQTPAMNKEIYFGKTGENEISNTVIFENIQKLNNSRHAISVFFNIGPL